MIQQFYKNFTHFLNNLKLKQKLLLSYFILILIPLGLFTFISYQQAAKAIENQVLFSAKQVFEQTNSFLTYKINKIIDISDIIAVDRNVNNILNKNPRRYRTPDQLKDTDDLTAYLKSFQKNDEGYQLRLYVNDQFIYSQEHVNLFSLYSAQKTGWYQRLNNFSGKVMWSPAVDLVNEGPNKPSTIAAVRFIRDLNWYSRYIGILRIDIPESSLQQIISNANTTKHGVAYLVNSTGQIVAGSDNDRVGQWGLKATFLQSLASRKNPWAELRLRGQKVLVGSSEIRGTDWVLVSVILYGEMFSPSINIRNQMFLLMLLLGTIAYILAYYIAYLTTKRIELLIQQMRKVQNADLNAKITAHNTDEIGELADNFNYMIEKMSVMVKEHYQSGQEVKGAELKALQAQINPHFLYNTLDLINWSAIKNNVPTITELVQKLAKFYKLSLNKGKDIISIQDELEHVALYVDIQNRRFENRLNFQLDLDEAIYQYSIVKIILQPLVENSILHGIMEKESKTGTIRINGKVEQEQIILTIEDDGVGIPREKLEKILQENKAGEGHGYGIVNINNRIKLYYGEEFGLMFRSVPGEGTTVEIRIPAIKNATYKS